MRKHVKFLALILAVILTLQVAPMVIFGDSADAGTYQDDGQETTNDTGSEPEPPAEPEDTEAPETEPEPDESTLSVNEIQWRQNGTNTDFITIEDGAALLGNKIMFRVNLSEKAESLSVKIDGKEMTYSTVLSFVFITAELVTGVHKMEVTAQNQSGTAVKTVSFRIVSTKAYPTFDLEAPADLLRGETAEIRLNGTNLQNVDTLSMTVEIDRSFKVEDVTLPDGVVGMYMWYRGELQIVAEVVDPSKVTDGCLAVISVKAPSDVSAEDFTWTVKSSEVTLTADSGLGTLENFAGGFQVETPEVGVSYAYIVEIEGSAVKGAEFTLSVKHYDGSVVANAPVYAVIDGENVLIGTTDAEGKLTTKFFDTLDSYTIYAETEDGVLSETATVTCITPVGNENGQPYGITVNAPVYNGKSITWMSHLLASSENAVLRLSTVPTMTNAVEIFGTSVVTYYNDGANVNRVNSVAVTDLAPGFTYYYQIGDGTTWSEIRSFTVRSESESVSFAVLGGAGGANASNTVVNAIMNGGTAYDFAIQTGNAITNPADYAAWVTLQAQMKGLDLDTIRALSATEREDATVNTIFGISERVYSYEIGNVYVAVVNAETAEDLKDYLYWVYDNAKASSCTWKLLVIHESVYTTNSAAYNEAVSEWVPYFAELSGIDMVFSGADGNYGRTAALKGNAVNEQNGVIYVNVGSLGVKGESFNAGSEFAYATNEFNAIYLGVTATADELIVTAYNVAEDGTVTAIDTVSKTVFVCAEGDHSYRINYPTSSMICEICDHRVAINEYTGPFWLGQELYFGVDGSYKSGWVTHNGDTYYFAPSTLNAVDGEYTIGGYTYLFENYKLKIGAWFERDGNIMLKWAGVTQKSTWITMDGKTYYFNATGARVSGLTVVPVEKENDVVVNEYHLFDEDGVHQGRLEDGVHVFEDLDMILYTENGVAKHKGLVMDEEGNFYYINSSGMGVRNVTRTISGKWTNGLLPDGTYTFGADGKMIDPPTVTE